MMKNVVTPYEDQEKGKKEQVAQMFDNIAKRYDFLNHFLSMGIDRRWRKKAISMLAPAAPKKILDVACGTGDFALEALKIDPEHITGIDISVKMLDEGKVKIKELGLSEKIDLLKGDAENIQFADESFDAVTVAFGVRNFENLQAGLKDICRVLKTGGQLVVLEFSRPTGFPLKQLFGLYFRYILPTLGAIISRDGRAYRYLHDSVEAFPQGNDFEKIMQECGYSSIQSVRLMSGIATIYVGKK